MEYDLEQEQLYIKHCLQSEQRCLALHSFITNFNYLIECAKDKMVFNDSDEAKAILLDYELSRLKSSKKNIERARHNIEFFRECIPYNAKVGEGMCENVATEIEHIKSCITNLLIGDLIRKYKIYTLDFETITNSISQVNKELKSICSKTSNTLKLVVKYECAN